MALQFLNDGYFAGKVGIGTESPVSSLNITTTKTVALDTAAKFLTLGLTVDDLTAGNTAGGGGGIAFRSKNTNAGTQIVFGAIDAIKESANVSDFRGSLRFFTNQNSTGIPLERMRIASSGAIKFNDYGSGTFTGTEAYRLAVDSSGNIIETIDGGGTVTGSGAATQVAFWDGTSSIAGNNNLYWDSTNNHLGIGDSTPGSRLKVLSGTSETSIYTVDIKHERNDANVATNAVRINMDLSGADTTTADRTNSGLLIDIDSSANGDASNEHRIYGVNSTINFTGFTDQARSGYFLAESNYTGAKTAQLIGVYGRAIHDASDAAGGVSNMMGVYGYSSIQDLGDVDNAFGVYGLVSIGDDRDADVGVTKAIEGEITIDKSTAIDYDTMIGISSVIDNNEGAVPNFGDQYLFKGDYQGTKGSNAYGIYTEGNKNYFEGNVGIGITSPGVKLHVESASLGGSINDTTTQAIFEADTASSDKLYIQNYRTVAGTAWTSNGKRIQEKIDSTWMGYIQFNGGETVSSGNGDISFGTGQSTTQSSVTEKMRIDSSGNVGIGTASPENLLHIKAADGVTGVLKIEGGKNIVTSVGEINSQLDFGSNDASVWSSGNVGARISSVTEATNGALIGMAFSTFKQGPSAPDSLSERMRIDNSGNVAIGVTTTGAKLQIDKANANSSVIISRSGTNIGTSTGVGSITFPSHYNSSYTDYAAIQAYSNALSSVRGSLDLKVKSTSGNLLTGMTVYGTSSGVNVGIGTTSPSEKLDVAGNIKIQAALLSNQENTDIDSAAAEVVAQVAIATYTAAFFDFVVKKGTNVRSGTVYACHDGDTTPLVEFTETSTNDLGDTSDVTLSVDISGANMRLLATVTSDDWSVKSLIRAI